MQWMPCTRELPSVLRLMVLLSLSTGSLQYVLADEQSDGTFADEKSYADICWEGQESIINKSVCVLGRVISPGTFDHSAGMTVFDAVEQAGGFDLNAIKSEFNVQGAGSDGWKAVSGEASLQPGDIVDVSEQFF